MNASVCRPLLLRLASSSVRPCRTIAGRRLSPAPRLFSSRSSFAKDAPDHGSASETPIWVDGQRTDDTTRSDEFVPSEERQGVTKSSSTTPADSAQDQETGSELPDGDGQVVSGDKVAKSPYGSAKKRARRNLFSRSSDATTTRPVHFIENNIRLYSPVQEEEPMTGTPGGEGNQAKTGSAEVVENVSLGTGGYEVNTFVMAEVHTSVAAGLRPTWAGEVESLPAAKPHLVLQSPKEGGAQFLDAVVQATARSCRADVVSVDAQDIAEFASDQVATNPSSFTSGTLRTLAYDANIVPTSSQKDGGYENEGDDSMLDDMDDEQDTPTYSKRSSSKSSGKTYAPQVIMSAVSNIDDIFKVFRGNKAPGDLNKTPPGQQPSEVRKAPLPTDLQHVTTMIETLLNEAKQMRLSGGREPDVSARSDHSTATSPALSSDPSQDSSAPSADAAEASAPKASGTILHIKDYLEIDATAAGTQLIRAIHDLVLRKRKEGERILLVGTTSAEDLLPSFSDEGFNDLQNEANHGPYRTIIVPCAGSNTTSILESDERARTRDINIRHLQEMIKRLTPDPEQTAKIVQRGNLELDSAVVYSSGLDEEIWSFDHIHRLASISIGMWTGGQEMMRLGLWKKETEMTAKDVVASLEMMLKSDTAKSSWLAEDKKQDAAAAANMASVDIKKTQEERISKLRKKCNSYEKKLLNGVIDVSSIKTTFTDIQAPPATIEGLKTLTSLSLARPEAFTYGVLAAEKIPGLLLYGPPGTGKTLLAKAVAKESGATVLEVTGSDIYDMYVGEGEKNVRAIFSLAKKISPCVVFIDEADAIFGSRTNSSTRTTHREIINQFLREWDGMSEQAAFIMVATNRPFDLDDAVLRRLPRRLLIDLPTEKDREAILKIHLGSESLDASISTADIAAKTPYYSGSDLKNVCVAAALECVREETTAAANHTGEEAHRYPEKRTLRNEHFDKALADISASIADDMSSLAAIRKFDEKYGDRKGRRKKSGGVGFGTLTEKEREKIEDGRVRQEK